jgi:hypothetical protein
MLDSDGMVFRSLPAINVQRARSLKNQGSCDLFRYVFLFLTINRLTASLRFVGRSGIFSNLVTVELVGDCTLSQYVDSRLAWNPCSKEAALTVSFVMMLIDQPEVAKQLHLHLSIV